MDLVAARPSLHFVSTCKTADVRRASSGGASRSRRPRQTMDMAVPVVAELRALEDGLVAYDARQGCKVRACSRCGARLIVGAQVFVRCTILAGIQDNPQAGKMASVTGRAACFKCFVRSVVRRRRSLGSLALQAGAGSAEPGSMRTPTHTIQLQDYIDGAGAAPRRQRQPLTGRAQLLRGSGGSVLSRPSASRRAGAPTSSWPRSTSTGERKAAPSAPD